MSTAAERDAEVEGIVRKVQKLLSLAAKNGNEAEAASAAAKAQELLAAYNLDLSTIEQASGDTGKREDARVRGGMYVYEREMWEAIAQLNFCFYFTLRLRHKTERKDRHGFPRTTYGWRFEHKIIGRVVNTTSTKVLGQYLQGTVAASAVAGRIVAYREGMSDRVGEKLAERRRHLMSEEAKKAAKLEADARRAARAGVSTATTLTLVDVAKSEEAANYDFMHGDGAWARKQQAEAEWEAGWEKRRAARAAAERAAEAEYARWAEANPEEAKKEAARVRANERAAERRASRGGGRRYRASTDRERRQSSSYYVSGYDKGDSISLEPQVDKDGSGTRRLR